LVVFTSQRPVRDSQRKLDRSKPMQPTTTSQGTKSPLHSITPSFSMCWIKPLLDNVLCWAIRTAFHTLKYAISIYFPGRSTGMQECENGFPNSNHSLGMKTPCSPSLSSLCACHRRKLLHVVGHEPNIAHRDGVAVMLHLFRPAFRQPAARCFVELLPSQELLDVGLGVVLVFPIPRLDEVQVVNCLASTSVPGEAGSKTRHSQEEGATHR